MVLTYFVVHGVKFVIYKTNSCFIIGNKKLIRKVSECLSQPQRITFYRGLPQRVCRNNFGLATNILTFWGAC